MHLVGGPHDPALVFLHGFAHTPASWREVLAALAPAGAVQLCPTPGHDPAVPVEATWEATLGTLARRLPPEAIVIGYSFGARVALGLLARDAVRAAVLIGVNPGLASEDDRAARRRADAGWADLLRQQGTAAFLARWEAQPLFASQARASAEVRARRQAERAALTPDGLAASLEVLGLGAMPDLTPALGARANRAHLVVGDEDPRFRAIADRLADQAGVRVDVVVGSGHDPTLEAPAALAAVIGRAVDRLTRVGA